jgi:hypothetical protein
MSSLNPFAARREKREEKIKERLGATQSTESMPDIAPSSADFSGAGLSDAQISAITERGGGSYESEDFDKYLPASAKVDQQPTTWSGGAGGQYAPPSRARQCMGRVQNGFVIGASLGGAVGFLYGSYAAVAYKHILYLPIAVLQAAGGFGFFLACGTVIRCEELPEERWAPLDAAARPLPYAGRKHLASAAAPPSTLQLRPNARDLPAAAESRSVVVDAVLAGSMCTPQSRWLA